MYDSTAGGGEPATLRRPALPPDPSPLASAGLGKRQGNLLTAVLRGIPLVGRDGMVPFAEADVRACLARFQPQGENDGAAAALANRLRPRLLNAAVGAEARLRGYVMGLPEGGVEPLLAAAGRAARAPLVLRVVYGASVCLPLRALSYVLPAVRMAERITAEAGRACYLQVVHVGLLGARINALPEEAVAAEGALLARGLQRMLAGVAPGLRYGIFTDLPLPAGGDPLAAVLDRLGPAARRVIAERLRDKGGSESVRQTLEYAAAHALVHDRGAVPLALAQGVPAPEGPVVVDVGGLQERHFYAVRRTIAGCGGPAPGPLVLTRHSVPPYTMSRGGDLGLRDYLAGARPDENTLPSAVQHDLRLLRASWALDHLG